MLLKYDVYSTRQYHRATYHQIMCHKTVTSRSKKHLELLGCGLLIKPILLFLWVSRYKQQIKKICVFSQPLAHLAP